MPSPDRIDPRDVAVIVLGGGRGSRLYPLTRDRAKPAVNFGGKYRLVDITLTNCLRSKLDNIYIVTQFNSFSLNRHIWQTYSRTLQGDSYIDVIAAEQTEENRDWFQGTADAVRQSLRHVLRTNPRYILILSADQIYNMDYRDLLRAHLEQKADVTIAARFTPEENVHSLGVVGVDETLRVTRFFEKPDRLEDVAGFRVTDLPGIAAPADKPFLCSMGLYLFNTDVLVDALSSNETDFGHSIIPQSADRSRMQCFPFDGYWEDVGTIGAFFQANMDWRAGRGIAAMFRQGDRIITHARQLPPARIQGTTIRDSLVASGSHIHAAEITRSIIGVRTRIGDDTIIEDSIICGNDGREGPVPFEVGSHCRIRRAIIDKNAVIGDNAVIENAEGVQEFQSDLYCIREGIVVIPRGAFIPQGAVI
ncbi:NTP transferase domain-containing protein [bacterium]|nr:NTP transferase domain-containing protein [bacterium]